MASKRKSKRAKKTATAPTDDPKVVSIETKRAEKIVERVGSLVDGIARGIDATIATILERYREWERENPDDAIRTIDKMAMVRLGFMGHAGFHRCHEPHRKPTNAYISEDGDLDWPVLDDCEGSEVLMCPAMETGRCKGAWKAMDMPPCELLLLEVNAGLGGGIWDERVNAVLEDYERDRCSKPEDWEKSFRRAAKLKRRYRHD